MEVDIFVTKRCSKKFSFLYTHVIGGVASHRHVACLAHSFDRIMNMLTRDKIEEYNELGYIVLESFFSGHKLSQYAEMLDEIRRNWEVAKHRDEHYFVENYGDDNELLDVLHKVQGVCVVEPRVLQIVGDRDLLDIIEQFVGPNIDAFGTKFFPKLPRDGTSTKWHLDNFYDDKDRKHIVSCAIYYEDTDRENGCLHVIPRSHTDSSLVKHYVGPDGKGVWAPADETSVKDVVCSAGSVVIFSDQLIHGAYNNTSEDRCRYSTAWHYISGDRELESFGRSTYADRFNVRDK